MEVALLLATVNRERGIYSERKNEYKIKNENKMKLVARVHLM